MNQNSSSNTQSARKASVPIGGLVDALTTTYHLKHHTRTQGPQLPVELVILPQKKRLWNRMSWTICLSRTFFNHQGARMPPHCILCRRLAQLNCGLVAITQRWTLPNHQQDCFHHGKAIFFDGISSTSLRNAPQTFLRFTNPDMRGIDFAFSYMSDFVFSR